MIEISVVFERRKILLLSRTQLISNLRYHIVHKNLPILFISYANRKTQYFFGWLSIWHDWLDIQNTWWMDGWMGWFFCWSLIQLHHWCLNDWSLNLFLYLHIFEQMSLYTDCKYIRQIKHIDHHAAEVINANVMNMNGDMKKKMCWKRGVSAALYQSQINDFKSVWKTSLITCS